MVGKRWKRFVRVASVLVTLAGCGRASQPSPGDDAARADSAQSADTRASAALLAPDGLRATSVYFADRDGRRLIPVTRYLSPDSGLARGAVLALLAGPRTQDPPGIASAVPGDSRLLDIVVRDSVATVDVSRAFESGAGSALIRMRLAQLTYTLTRLAGVRRIQLHIEGRTPEAFSSEGLVVSEGLARGDFSDLAPLDEDPPIIMTEPVPGSTVRGPIVVRGSANVFEAHLGLRIREPSGRVWRSTWTTATCGSGCRGTFEKTLSLPDSARGDLVIEAFEPSAKDGSDLHPVESLVHRAP